MAPLEVSMDNRAPVNTAVEPVVIIRDTAAMELANTDNRAQMFMVKQVPEVCMDPKGVMEAVTDTEDMDMVAPASFH